ncbi:MAG: hypothetical protein QRY72_05320 [Candidatus Rhabdochlamydia sp.]
MLIQQDLINPKTNQSVASLTKDDSGKFMDITVHAHLLIQSLKFSGMTIPLESRIDHQQTHLYLNDQSKNPSYFAEIFVKYFYEDMLAQVGYYWKDIPLSDDKYLPQHFGALKI